MKIFIEMQSLTVEMIKCNKYSSQTYNNKHENYKLRTLKRLRNKVWGKSRARVTAKWKLTWTYRSQNI